MSDNNNANTAPSPPTTTTARPTLNVFLDGYTVLPKGHVATTITYLHMLSPPARSTTSSSTSSTPRSRFRLDRLHGSDAERYLSLFIAVGENHLWHSRLQLTRQELIDKLDEQVRQIFALVDQDAGADVGILELDFTALGGKLGKKNANEIDNDIDSGPGSVEILFFGVTPFHFGTGAALFLMNAALDLAWSQATCNRVFLLTFSWDSPRALNFYKKFGFVPYRVGIDVRVDPRLSGLLPRTAAPQIPFIE